MESVIGNWLSYESRLKYKQIVQACLLQLVGNSLCEEPKKVWSRAGFAKKNKHKHDLVLRLGLLHPLREIDSEKKTFALYVFHCVNKEASEALRLGRASNALFSWNTTFYLLLLFKKHMLNKIH